jgi:hypothetical protein
MACVCPWARGLTFTFWRDQIPRRFSITLRDGVIYRRSTAWRGGFWSIDLTWNPPRQVGDIAEVSGKTFRVTRESAGGFHYHFHLAVDAEWIDNEWLQEAWAKLRGQAFSVVDVIDVKGTDYVAEVCKYVCDGVQLGNWPAQVLVQFIESLSEQKCFGCFGSLYKQRAEWRKDIDEIHADRNVCECGCRQFEFYDESEWEWQQAKSSLSPPPSTARHLHRFHPELFAPVASGVR